LSLSKTLLLKSGIVILTTLLNIMMVDLNRGFFGFKLEIVHYIVE